MGVNMEKIKLGEKEYDGSDLSDEAKAHVASLRFLKTEILRAKAMLAALQTAEIGYTNALKKMLEDAEVSDEDDSDMAGVSDNITFGN